jgi:hypothetical protein
VEGVRAQRSRERQSAAAYCFCLASGVLLFTCARLSPAAYCFSFRTYLLFDLNEKKIATYDYRASALPYVAKIIFESVRD